MAHKTLVVDVATIAGIAHEVNRAYSLTHGDTSHLPWDESPEVLRKSTEAGVRMHLNHPETTPEQSHRAWLEYKRQEGWQYGEVKDLDKKEHPCMCPYHLLPKDQQIKDHLFKAVVEAFRGRADVIDL